MDVSPLSYFALFTPHFAERAAVSEIAVKMTGDEQALLKSLAASQAAVAKLEERIRALGEAGKQQKKATEEGFGGKALGDLQSYAAGLVSVTAAAAAVVGTLQKIRQENQQLAEGLKGQEGGLKRLSQVATSPAEFEQLRGMAKKVALTEGMPMAQAAGFVFQAKSQGLLGDLDALAATSRFTDAEAMAQSVGKFKSAFGAAEAGSAESLVSKFIQAASSSDVAIEDIARAAVIPAQAMVGVGAGDEELLGLVSALSPAFKSPETAAQRLQALATVVNRGVTRKTGRRVRDPITKKLVAEEQQIQFGGGGLLAGLERYQTEFPEEFKAAMLQSVEAGAAAQAIATNLPTVRQRVAEVTAAGTTLAPLRQQQQITDQGVLKELRQTARSQVAAELAGEGAGLQALSYEQERSRFVAAGRQAGGLTRFMQTLTSAGYDIEATLFGDEWAKRRVRSRFSEEELSGGAIADQMLEQLARQTEIMQTERTPGGIAPQELERSGN